MPTLRLSWTVLDGQDCLRVDGLPLASLGSLRRSTSEFALLPEEAAAAIDVQQIQPINGEFVVDGDSLCFRPRFPFRDGTTYVLLRGEGIGGWRAPDARRWTIERPTSDAGPPSTRVVALYPDVDEVPFNLLKFYIEFSSPMSEGFAQAALSVRRADTAERLEGVFASMHPELWDPDKKRLTLLLDPGRIKRGLVPNAEAGYPLVPGVPIVISVAASARDAQGRPLAASFERTYRVGGAVRERVMPDRWRLTLPAGDTRQPLTVRFDRPLDHALLQHSIRVVGPLGELSGLATVTRGDRGWQFVPDDSWARGPYQLVVDRTLEDLAGNSVARVFDRDLEVDEVASDDASVVPWRPG